MDKLISEREWTIKQSKIDSHLPFLSYTGITTTSFVTIIFCYCYCKCCKTKFPNFFKWWKNNNPCITIVIKLKVINSVHSSRESLRIPISRTSKIRKPLQGDMEETDLVLLKTCNARVIPSGKT